MLCSSLCVALLSTASVSFSHFVSRACSCCFSVLFSIALGEYNQNVFLHFAVDGCVSRSQFGATVHGADISTSSGEHACVFLLGNPRRGSAGLRVGVCSLLLIGGRDSCSIKCPCLLQTLSPWGLGL